MPITTVSASQGEQVNIYRRQLERQQEGSAANTAQTPSQVTPSSQSQADTAHFSDAARLLAETGRAAASAPDIREAKVAALRAQVQAGQYHPDSAAIARSLLTEDSAIFGV